VQSNARGRKLHPEIEAFVYRNTGTLEHRNTVVESHDGNATTTAADATRRGKFWQEVHASSRRASRCRRTRPKRFQ